MRIPPAQKAKSIRSSLDSHQDKKHGSVRQSYKKEPGDLDDWWIDDDHKYDDSVDRIVGDIVPLSEGLKYLGLWGAAKIILNIIWTGIIMSITTLAELFEELWDIWLLNQYTNDGDISAYGMSMMFSGIMVHHLMMALTEKGGIEISMAFGSRNPEKCSKVFFQMFTVQIICAMIATVVFIFSHPIMLLVGIAPDTALLTSKLLHLEIALLWLEAIDDPLITFCYSIGIEKPWGYISAGMAPFAMLFSYMFVGYWRMGVVGLVYAHIVALICYVVITVILFFRWTKPKYRRWVGTKKLKEGFADLTWQMVVFGLAHFVHILAFETMSFFVYRTNDKQQISAFVTAMDVANMFFFVGESIEIAIRTRLNMMIGEGENKAAKNLLLFFIPGLWIFAGILGLVCVFTRYLVADLFVKGRPVVHQQMADLLFLVGIFAWNEMSEFTLDIAMKTIRKVKILILTEFFIFFGGVALAGYILIIRNHLNTKYLFVAEMAIGSVLEFYYLYYVWQFDWSTVTPDEEEQMLDQLEFNLDDTPEEINRKRALKAKRRKY